MGTAIKIVILSVHGVFFRSLFRNFQVALKLSTRIFCWSNSLHVDGIRSETKKDGPKVHIYSSFPELLMLTFRWSKNMFLEIQCFGIESTYQNRVFALKAT